MTTNLFTALENTQPTLALAFAVASLQCQGFEGLNPISQALLDVAVASQSVNSNSCSSGKQQVHGKQQITMSSTATSHQSFYKKQDDEDKRSYSSFKQELNISGDDDDEEEEETLGCENGDDGSCERRLARSRERNREHARRTRLRKKAQLEALQSKVKGLEAERQLLKLKVEECGIASILVGLSSGLATTRNTDTSGEGDDRNHEDATAERLAYSSLTSSSEEDGGNGSGVGGSESSESDTNNNCDNNTKITERRSDMVAVLSGVKRKRFISEAIGEQTHLQQQQKQHRLTINIDGKVTEIGIGKSHINWKTGMYRDNDGVQKKLTLQQLEDLRRERNRIHAKMTRSRKKCFIATIEQAISELEAENCRMKRILEGVAGGVKGASSVASSVFSSPTQILVTPATSPALTSVAAPPMLVLEESSSNGSSSGCSAAHLQPGSECLLVPPSFAATTSKTVRSHMKRKSESFSEEKGQGHTRASHGFRLVD